MKLTDAAKEYLGRMTGGAQPPLAATDPEFIERFASFAFDEVVSLQPGDDAPPLDDRTRFLAIIATCLGCQGLDEFRTMVPAALRMGVTAVELREVIYQAAAYLGIARVYPFLNTFNEILLSLGYDLPLPDQATTTAETRLEAGNQCQVDIFGEGMRRTWEKQPAETAHIARWLADNCFGDWYTRSGLDLRERELVTFCLISAQGGCESQLIAHAGGNLNMGNTRGFLIQVISACVPFIGYPRSLNALNAVNKACEGR